MPFAVPFVASFFAAAGASAAVATFAAQATISLATLGASYALNALLAPKQQKQKAPESRVTSRMDRAPRRYCYGRVMVGGYEVFAEAIPANSINNKVWQILAHCDGPITAYEQTFLDDLEVRFDAATSFPGINGGQVNHPGQWTGSAGVVAALYSFYGTTTQSAFNPLVAALPNLWTANHKLGGVAYTVTQWLSGSTKDFARIYKGGRPPPVRHVIKAYTVYDPRDGSMTASAPSTWSFTGTTGIIGRNAACIIISHLLRPEANGGLGIASSFIDMPSFQAFANVCEEVIARGDGSSEYRWCLDVVYNSTDDPKDVLATMMQCCAAELYENTSGLIAIRGGRYVAPTITITDTNIVSCELERGPDVFTAVNYIKPSWVSMEMDFASSECAPVTDAALIAAAGRNIIDTLNYPYVTQHHQARRLAQLEMNRRNAGWRGKITTDLTGIAAWDHHNVNFTLSWLGITAQPFRVISRTLGDNADTIEWEVVATGSGEYTAPTLVAPPTLAPATDNASRVPAPRTCTAVRNGGTGITTFTIEAPTRGDMYIRIRSWRDGEATATPTSTQGGNVYTLTGTFQDVKLIGGVYTHTRNDLTAGTTVRFLVTYISQDQYETEYALIGAQIL